MSQRKKRSARLHGKAVLERRKLLFVPDTCRFAVLQGSIRTLKVWRLELQELERGQVVKTAVAPLLYAVRSINKSLCNC